MNGRRNLSTISAEENKFNFDFSFKLSTWVKKANSILISPSIFNMGEESKFNFAFSFNLKPPILTSRRTVERIDPKDLPEFITVDLAEVRKDVECAICLGIIKKTRTVMGCMHRFCKECIEKSIKTNNECPACRLHCASRRCARKDHNYDKLIRVLFQDIEKYEAEEFCLLEKEKTCNEKIQESIAQIYERQSGALNKRAITGKDTAGDASTPGSTQNNGRGSTRRGRNNTNTIVVLSDDEDVERVPSIHEQERQETENKKGKIKRGRRGRACSLAAINLDAGNSENEIRGTYQRLSWGGVGTRSHTRNGIASGSKGTTRLNTLVNHLQNTQVNDNKVWSSSSHSHAESTLTSPEVHEQPNNFLVFL